MGPGLLDLVLSIHMHGRVLDPRGIRVISALFRGGGFQESNHGISTCWSQLGFQLCYGNPAPGITVNRPVVVLDADKQLRFPPLFTRSDPLFEEFVKRAGVTLRHLGRHIGGTHTHSPIGHFWVQVPVFSFCLIAFCPSSLMSSRVFFAVP